MSSRENTPPESPKPHSRVMSVENILLMERPGSANNVDKQASHAQDTSEAVEQQENNNHAMDDENTQSVSKEEEEIENQLADHAKADSTRSVSPNMVQNEPPKKKRKKTSKPPAVEEPSLETTPAPDAGAEPGKKRKRASKKITSSKSRKTSADETAEDGNRQQSRPPSSGSNNSAMAAQGQVIYQTNPNPVMYGPDGTPQGQHYAHPVHYGPSSLPPMMHQPGPPHQQQYGQFPGWNPYAYHHGGYPPNVGMGMGYMPPPPGPNPVGHGQYSYMSLPPPGAYPYGIGPPPGGPYLSAPGPPGQNTQNPYGPGPGYSMSGAYPNGAYPGTESASSNGKSKGKAERKLSSSKPATPPTPSSAAYAQAHDSVKRIVSNGTATFNSASQSNSAGGTVVTPAGVLLTDDAMTKVTDRVQRKCFNCSTTDTSTWRRSNLYQGKVLCNKCGLFERTHRRARPDQFVARRGPSDESEKRPQQARADSDGNEGKSRLKQGTQAVLNLSHEEQPATATMAGIMSNQYPHSEIRQDQVQPPQPYYGSGPGPALGMSAVVSATPSSTSYLRLSTSTPTYSGARSILNADGDQPGDNKAIANRQDPSFQAESNYGPTFDAPQPQTYQQAISNSRDSPSPAASSTSQNEEHVADEEK